MSTSETSLKGIDLEIPAGTLFTLLGLPKSGKSLLLKAIMGLVDYAEGSIQIAGGCVHDYSSQIWYLPRQMMFPPDMTVLEIIRYYSLRERKIDHKGLAQFIDPILKQLDLTEQATAHYDTLTPFHKWYVMIAAMSVSNASIFLCDEPFHDLTTVEREVLFTHLKQLLPQTTIVFTTTSLADATMADAGALLHDGQIVVHGKFDHLIADENTAIYDLTIVGDTSHILPIIESLSWVDSVEQVSSSHTGHWHIKVKNETHAEGQLLRAILADHDLYIRNFQLIRPRLKEIFDKIRSEHRDS